MGGALEVPPRQLQQQHLPQQPRGPLPNKAAPPAEAIAPAIQIPRRAVAISFPTSHIRGANRLPIKGKFNNDGRRDDPRRCYQCGNGDPCRHQWSLDRQTGRYGSGQYWASNEYVACKRDFCLRRLFPKNNSGRNDARRFCG